MSLAGLTFCFYAILKAVSRSTLPDKDLPFISIVVPARNEEGKIRRCLESLLSQDYPDFEIVVIDDRSTDKTGQIIAELAAGHSRIKFVKGSDVPEGWIGKCNALVHASAHASGEWYLFTDADTWHRSNSVRDSVSYALTHKADLVSFVPVQELGSFWERAVMPVLLGSFLCGDPFHTVNDQQAERAYAYGQYILARRSAYLASGGHQSVRDEIVEDHALARVVKSKGFHVLCADGHDLYKVRMYTDLESMWQGWTKNIYALLECRLLNLLIVLTLINSAFLMPFLQLAMLVALAVAGETDGAFPTMVGLVSLQLLILFVWYRRTSHHYDGVSLRHFLLLPLGSITVTALYLHSAYLVLSGGQVNWKGRHYRVNSAKTIDSLPNAHLDPALDAALTRKASD